MLRWSWTAGLVAAALMAGAARADRVPSSKAMLPPDPGARANITVPYLTNGWSNLGVWSGVAPRVYQSPIVDDPRNPQVKPVFNLIFYGSTMQFGDASNGAAPRPGNVLRPPRP